MGNEYFWCHLSNGDKRTVGYVEKRGAKIGLMVEMIDLDGEFWKVDNVADEGVTKEYVRNNEKRFKSFQASLKGGGIE